jgi:hypothetical protein
MAQSQPTPQPTPTLRAKPRRRIRRTTMVRAVALLIGLGAIALVIFARSGVARHAVLPRIAEMINAEVDAEAYLRRLTGEAAPAGDPHPDPSKPDGTKQDAGAV